MTRSIALSIRAAMRSRQCCFSVTVSPGMVASWGETGEWGSGTVVRRTRRPDRRVRWCVLGLPEMRDRGPGRRSVGSMGPGLLDGLLEPDLAEGRQGALHEAAAFPLPAQRPDQP